MKEKNFIAKSSFQLLRFSILLSIFGSSMAFFLDLFPFSLDRINEIITNFVFLLIISFIQIMLLKKKFWAWVVTMGIMLISLSFSVISFFQTLSFSKSLLSSVLGVLILFLSKDMFLGRIKDPYQELIESINELKEKGQSQSSIQNAKKN